MLRKMDSEFGHFKTIPTTWVPVTPTKFFISKPEVNLHSQIDGGLPFNHDAFDALYTSNDRDHRQSELIHENKKDIDNSTSDIHQDEPAKDVTESSSSPIITPSKKRDDKNRDSSNIDLKEKSSKSLKRKKHRPKVVVEGVPKRNNIPKTPKLVTPSRTPPRKYVRKNKKVGETDLVVENVKKSCKRSLNFIIKKNYPVDDIQNCTVQESLFTCKENEVELSSSIELKREECVVEKKIAGETDLKNVIEIDYSFKVPLRVYKRSFSCLTNSRNLGPNFPKICKRRRLNRRRSETTCSTWLSPAVEEHGEQDYRLRNKNNSANICSLINAMSKKSIIRKDPFLCMVSLCNFSENTKKKMRSKRSIPRQNVNSLNAIPKCNQMSLTPSKPIKFTMKRSKLLQVHTNLLLPPVNGTMIGERHIQEENFCKRRIYKRKQKELGPSLVNVESCYNNSAVSTLALAHHAVFGQGQEVGLLQEFDSNNKIIVLSSNQKKRVFKKQRPNEGGLQSKLDELILTSNFKDPLQLFNVIEYISQRLEGLHIKESENGALVPYEGPFDPKKKRKKLSGKVNLDEETLRMWNLLMLKDGTESADNTEDEDKKKWWENERNVFKGRVDSFIARMHLIQGDRRFSPWKGSVVDSVVGVFLTQNVSDHLSSSAFMSLVAKYPIQSTRRHTACHEHIELLDDQKLSGPYMIVEEPEDNSEAKECTTHELDNMVETLKKELIMVASDEDSSTNKINSSKNAQNLPEQPCSSSTGVKEEPSQSETKKKGANENKEEIKVDWDKLRKLYSDGKKQRSSDTMDSVDWHAVKNAPLDEVANTIKKRGQHFNIGRRIKDFLNRMVEDHGSIDLEWLRNVPPDDAKEYLLSIVGLGLKSVECIRLLELQQMAFPVDTNVGRIAVRLGWVPLQALPEELQIHLLEEYPIMDSIQKYIWPRLCKLEQRTLYELHYQMITFGKVFCTKRSPNCNPCPMRGECRHFASAFASAKLALPGTGEKTTVTSYVPIDNTPVKNTDVNATQSIVSVVEDNSNPNPKSAYQTTNCEPIIEEPSSPESVQEDVAYEERDIEDLFIEDDSDEIPVIKLNLESLTANVLEYADKYAISIKEDDISNALVALNYASIPRPKLKAISRLRTHHQAFELPDMHPLLIGLPRRELDDPSPYLLSILTPGESETISMQPPKQRCASQVSGEPCSEETCSSCNSTWEQNSQIVLGTLLIPCRTAMKGSFPLNGTYFQSNEVFSDHESSLNPIRVPTSLIWNLRRRSVYCGTSASAILKGLSTEEIQHCFWRGYICVRGFERKTGAPRPLNKRLHQSGMKKTKPEAEDS